MIFRRSVALVLMFQVIGGSLSPLVQSAHATQVVQSKASFATILRDHRAELEKKGTDSTDVMNRFVQNLLDHNVGVADVDQFVQGQLSAKEYKSFQKYMSTSMAGLDPNTLSSEEFGQIVEQALKATQSKGLTWSSCSTMTGGIVLGVAALVVGIVALAKSKIDFEAKKLITPQDLTATRDGEIKAATNSYKNKSLILRDPQTYYNGKIQTAYVEIGLNSQSIQEYQLRRSDAENRLSNLEYQYSQALTDDDRYYYSNEIDKVERQITKYNESISNLQSNNRYLLSDINSYTQKLIYYSDPATVAAERAELELWYPQALATAENKFQVSLANLDKTNELIREDNEARRIEIEEKNVDIAKTKKTLGIIAGVGGAASLAVILSSLSSCQKQGSYGGGAW